MSGLRDCDGEGARVSPEDGEGRASRWPPLSDVRQNGVRPRARLRVYEVVEQVISLSPRKTKTSNFLVSLDDRTNDLGILVRDRAGQFTVSFVFVLSDAGIDVVTIPPPCPRANRYAERFVGTDSRPSPGLLITNEHHLTSVLSRHLLPGRRARSTCIRRRPALDGVISENEPAAA